jgi:hypothetical protein
VSPITSHTNQTNQQTDHPLQKLYPPFAFLTPPTKSTLCHGSLALFLGVIAIIPEGGKTDVVNHLQQRFFPMCKQVCRFDRNYVLPHDFDSVNLS